MIKAERAGCLFAFKVEGVFATEKELTQSIGRWSYCIGILPFYFEIDEAKVLKSKPYFRPVTGGLEVEHMLLYRLDLEC